MTQNHHSLLRDPLIRVRPKARAVPEGWTLPRVLAALAGGEISSFVGLQPHQQQPWYCLLVQLAVLARTHGHLEDLSDDPQVWEEALLGLAGGEHSPWCMVVEDVSKPAFMQPPVPEGSLEAAKYKADIETPDELDMLVLSKNHDVKMRRIWAPELDQWLYALVTLQTMEGFLGRGNYGIARMNGGFASRPFVGLAPGLGWGDRFRRDVQMLMERRDDALERGGHHDRGAALLWLEPWDGGKTGVPLQSLDPYYVEICRRIRFTSGQDEGGVVVHRTNTKGARVAADKSLNGITGDPWTPVDRTDKQDKALTLSASGFTYRLVRELLMGSNYRQSLAQRLDEDVAEVHLLTQCLVRGQGTTEGLHQRVTTIPTPAARHLADDKSREALARRSEKWVDLASNVQRQVLYPTLRALLSAGGEDRPDASKVRPWTQAFDRGLDEVFFERLWATLARDDDEAMEAWQRELWIQARRQVDAAIEALPLPSSRRRRAVAAAENIFAAMARKLLPHGMTSEAATSGEGAEGGERMGGEGEVGA